MFIAITFSKDSLSLADLEASRAPKAVLFFLKKSVVKVFKTFCALRGICSFILRESKICFVCPPPNDLLNLFVNFSPVK